jgi:pimeloyl-ACP methyl ester carboxylesterase
VTRRDVRFASGDAECAAWHFGLGRSGVCVVMGQGLGAIKEVGVERFAERFAQAGHDVVSFDYRGFGASGGMPRQVANLSAQLEDWRAAAAFARSLPGVERIVLFGASLGGSHVLTLAPELPGLAAAIAHVPMADGAAAAARVRRRDAARLTAHALLDEVGSRLGRAPHTIPLVGPPGSLALLTTPDALPALETLNPAGVPWPNEIAARIALWLPRYRPVDSAVRITCPLLVVVCDHDALAPPGPAIRAARDAPRGELVSFPCEHYAVYEGEIREQAIASELAFLERCLVGCQPRSSA